MPGLAPTFQYLVAQNDTASWGDDARLFNVVVGKATASAVVTVYNGTATTDPVIAVIDGNVVATHNFSGMRCSKGLFVKLTAAGGNVTVIAA